MGKGLAGVRSRENPPEVKPGDDATRTALIRRIKRQRWSIRATLALGVTTSLETNILHTEGDFEVHLSSAWAPVALLVAVDQVARRRMRKKHMNYIGMVALTVIAGIAAYASYLSMVAYWSKMGFPEPLPRLLPLSVDGLVVLASAMLFDIEGELRELEAAAHQTSSSTTPAAISQPAPHSDPAPSSTPTPTVHSSQARRGPTAAPRPAPAAVPKLKEVPRADPDAPTDTKAAVAFYLRKHPTWSPADIATVINRSERTVRRNLPTDDASSGRESA